ncbi:MAG: hypothetical protein K0S37_1410, partial [Microbacterium sp.]|nr:hypothetical protein [Microbacterium sp.]
MTPSPRLAPVRAHGARLSNADFALQAAHGTDRGQIVYDFPGVLVGT